MTAKSPTEANVRRLVGVLAEFFPNGADSGDLRLKFQKIAHRSHATFYNCLASAKAKGWVVSDGRTYRLAADGSWRTSPIGEELERHQLAHVLEMRDERIEKLERANKRLKGSRRAIAAGEAAGPAIGALAMIMYDPAVSVRKRVQAAENLLAFKSPPDVAEAAKRVLSLIFLDPDQNVDDRLAATTALRRAEDVRIVPAIERPVRTDDTARVEEPVIPLADLIAQRRAYMERMEQERLASPEATPEEKQAIRASISRRNGNGNGSDSSSND